MNLVIMAAGVGSRLGSFFDNKPKCLIEAGGESLIARTVRLFQKRGVNNISIVTGYQSHLIQRELGTQVKYFHNPFYTVTNSIASLWLARHEIHEDTILMNGDLYFEEKLLNEIFLATHPVTMLADTSRIETADYRFGLENGNICRYGKQLTNSETDAEYVGIARVNRDFVHAFKQRLENLILQSQFHVWWEDAIYSQIAEGHPVAYRDVAGTFWTEIDCISDWDRLKNWIESHPQSPDFTALVEKGPRPLRQVSH